MPRTKPIPDGFPSDELLLAAIDRADRHRGRPEEPGVVLATVKEHLGLPRAGWTTRRLRPQLTALQAAGLIRQSRRRSSDVTTLTTTGHQRLDALPEVIASLPEAPQHQAWHAAHTAASERISQLRQELRETLDEAIHLLDATWPDPLGSVRLV